jgi:hypothetical protein
MPRSVEVLWKTVSKSHQRQKVVLKPYETDFILGETTLFEHFYPIFAIAKRAIQPCDIFPDHMVVSHGCIVIDVVKPPWHPAYCWVPHDGLKRCHRSSRRNIIVSLLPSSWHRPVICDVKAELWVLNFLIKFATIRAKNASKCSHLVSCNKTENGTRVFWVEISLVVCMKSGMCCLQCSFWKCILCPGISILYIQRQSTGWGISVKNDQLSCVQCVVQIFKFLMRKKYLFSVKNETAYHERWCSAWRRLAE